MNVEKPDITYLKHIRDCCQTILEYAGDMPLEIFLKDKKTQDAVIRNFEIIGEAVKHLSDDLRIGNSHIDWKGIAGLRDKLIHDYIGVDLWAVHNLIIKVIPGFYVVVKMIIQDVERN